MSIVNLDLLIWMDMSITNLDLSIVNLDLLIEALGLVLQVLVPPHLLPQPRLPADRPHRPQLGPGHAAVLQRHGRVQALALCLPHAAHHGEERGGARGAGWGWGCYG